MLSGLVRWSLDRPWLIACASLVLLLAAAFYVRDVRLEFLPDLAPVEAVVQTEAPGLVAGQVEQLVTRPVESALGGALGVAHVRSQSVQGLSVVTLTFAADADPARTREALLEHLAPLGSALPPGVGAPRLWPLRAEGAPVLQLGFVSDKLDPMALRDLVQWTVRPRLLAAPGVAEVAVAGGQVRRIEVRARPGDLADSDLGFLDILQAVRRATGVAGAGFIDTPNQRVLIAPQGQALTLDAVGAGQIQTPGAAPVRIADVADVVETPAPPFGDALIDGRPGVLVSVGRQYGADTLKVTRGVELALASLQPVLAAQHVEVRRDLDRPARFITATLRSLSASLAIGAGLVAIVLALALRDIRSALVAWACLPLSLLLALAAIKAMGWSLNTMTLGGLAVALGVVFDDAALDVENIAARLRDAERRGGAHANAILEASLQVRAPVVYATGAMVAAVLPLLALPGSEGVLLRPFAGAVIAASLASLLVAALVTPALASLALAHLRPGSAGEPSALQRAYASALGRVDAAPRAVVLAALLVSALPLAALAFAPAELLPRIHDGWLSATVQAPASISPEAMRSYAAQIMRELGRLPNVRGLSARIGRDPTDQGAAGLGTATIGVSLAPGLSAAAQDDAGRRIAAALRAFPAVDPVVRSRFDTTDEAGAPSAAFAVTVFGGDLDALDTTAARIVSALRRLPGGGSARVEPVERGPLVRVDLNFERLAIYGLSVADALDTIQAAFAGERVAQIYEGDRTIDLAISAQASLRRDPEAVGSLLLRSTSGVSAPLRSVANVYLTDGPQMIRHDDGLRRRVVLVDPPARDVARFGHRARAAIDREVRLAPGEFLDVAGADRAAAEGRRSLAVSYGLALLAVLGVLSVAFDGRTASLMVLSTLFSLFGGALAVIALRGVVSVGPITGLLALFGLSIRGTILLISRLEELVIERRRPWAFETVVQAAQERLRPLLLCSGVVALALAPLALQAGRGGFEVLGPMALVVIAGLVTGALAGLFVMPVLTFLIWRPGYARLARSHRASGERPNGQEPA
jgi:CzcA family heavy metal efflux pump